MDAMAQATVIRPRRYQYFLITSSAELVLPSGRMIQSPRHCASVGRSGFPYSEIRIRRVSQSLRISANFSIVSKAWGEALFHRLRVGTVYHRIIGGVSEHVGIDL